MAKDFKKSSDYSISRLIGGDSVAGTSRDTITSETQRLPNDWHRISAGLALQQKIFLMQQG